MSGHLLGQPVGNRRRESVGGIDDLGATSSVGGDLECRHARKARGEVDDVSDVRTAPLVDGLVVVADNAQLNPWRSEQLDQPLLGGIHVLVLIDDQMSERPGDLVPRGHVAHLVNGPRHLLPISEEAVPLE